MNIQDKTVLAATKSDAPETAPDYLCDYKGPMKNMGNLDDSDYDWDLSETEFENVVSRLVGDKYNSKFSRPTYGELRFNKHGSLSVNLSDRCWYSFEDKIGGNIIDLVRWNNGGAKRSLTEALQWIDAALKDTSPHPEPKPFETERVPWVFVAKWIYCDPEGKQVFKVVRKECDGQKIYFQNKYVGDGLWAPDVQGVIPIPYRLPELLAAISNEKLVFIVEGEKCAEIVRGLGLAATTNASGGGQWKKELNQWFAGADVVILPDNDDAGRAHAKKVSEELKGVAFRVRVLDLNNSIPIREKGDIEQWLDAGGTKERLLELLEAPQSTQVDLNIKTLADLEQMRFAELKTLVPGLLVEGCTIVAGRPKIGKSWMTLDIAIATAKGSMCFGDRHCMQGEVLYLALEDGERRLQSRVTKLLGAFKTNGQGNYIMSRNGRGQMRADLYNLKFG